LTIRRCDLLKGPTASRRPPRPGQPWRATACPGVDRVTVGYKGPNEIDEAIENLNLGLA